MLYRWLHTKNEYAFTLRGNQKVRQELESVDRKRFDLVMSSEKFGWERMKAVSEHYLPELLASTQS